MKESLLKQKSDHALCYLDLVTIFTKFLSEMKDYGCHIQDKKYI